MRAEAHIVTGMGDDHVYYQPKTDSTFVAHCCVFAHENGPLLQAVCEGGGAFYKLLAGGKIVLKMRFSSRYQNITSFQRLKNIVPTYMYSYAPMHKVI
jgi:hypothetical protein